MVETRQRKILLNRKLCTSTPRPYVSVLGRLSEAPFWIAQSSWRRRRQRELYVKFWLGNSQLESPKENCWSSLVSHTARLHCKLYATSFHCLRQLRFVKIRARTRPASGIVLERMVFGAFEPWRTERKARLLLDLKHRLHLIALV